jgi:lysophospholipase L1-like esterase
MNKLLLLAIAALLLPAADPVKIVCIGDSITQGRKGGGNAKPTQSWRYPLWKLLVDANAKVDFVGSLSEGFDGSPDWPDYKGLKFDRDHEGHWGWTTRGIREKLPEWIKGYAPDVALILLGTNDGGQKLSTDDSAKEMAGIIDLLRAKNPKVTVLLGTPFQHGGPFPEMKSKYEKMAKEKSTAASAVIPVDTSKGFVEPPDAKDTDTVDWVHPNPAGDAKLAKCWFDALQPVLKRLGAVK